MISMATLAPCVQPPHLWVKISLKKGNCRRPIGPLARREGDLGYDDILIRPLFQSAKMLTYLLLLSTLYF